MTIPICPSCGAKLSVKPLQDDIARLRAALQHIYGLDIRLTTETVEAIARKALEG